jgi:metacaspase-1
MTTRSRTRIAVLAVGINTSGDYRRYKCQLNGCVPDIRDILLPFLFAQRGLETRHLRTLYNADATLANIRDGLFWLTEQQADALIFLWSAHGTRIKDKDGDEARNADGFNSGYDQCLVPVDFSRGMITDDELAFLWSNVPKDVRITTFMDSCYSDRSDRGWVNDVLIERAWNRRTPRALPSKVQRRVSGEEEVQRVVAEQRAKYATFVPRPILSWSGCRHNETSAETSFNGKPHGANTYFLGQSLKLGGAANLSAAALIERVRLSLSTNEFTQQPQLTGPKEGRDLPLFT